MNVQFEKYHGTGNDFILVDIRNHAIPSTTDIIVHLCDRHYGIGADGLIMLGNSDSSDFSMRYFNADGLEASFCGNGGRCVAAFAQGLGIIKKEARFTAADGEHRAVIMHVAKTIYTVSLEMSDVVPSCWTDDHIVLETGSPHLIMLSEGIQTMDVFREGRKIRNDPRFAPDGINVNFIEHIDNSLHIRTYERGVEDETLSCGTGVTAAAIAWAIKYKKASPIVLQARGGSLKVHFLSGKDKFTEIRLEGPAEYVFSGNIEI